MQSPLYNIVKNIDFTKYGKVIHLPSTKTISECRLDDIFNRLNNKTGPNFIQTINNETRYLKANSLLDTLKYPIIDLPRDFLTFISKKFNIKSLQNSDLLQNYSTFASEPVQVLGHRYREMQPWKNIANGYMPNWWSRYNAVKHHRDEKENYKHANQKNAIEALSALYILIEYWAAKNFVVSKEEAFNRKGIEPSDRVMQRLKSSMLYMPNWKFYNSFIGQEPWFNPRAYYQYLEGGANA